MAMYLISYDLIKNKDYKKLYEAIMSYQQYAHITDSLWAIVSSKKAVEIINFLTKYIDNDDVLFVCEINGEAAWLNLNKDVSDWLKKMYS
ncbi:hypothetical protein [Snodgrassella alvi]|uniref:hypothetical protein n=1 Tax=Snodgrassella alvi TaxID=1196083 RepID=UPI000C1E8620|nr:hypothetical protein [Snodgrassella alvi]PIT14046.1 hypothetical protein BGI33_08240 [Snodgrassella alvi]PIT16138.1 hypothetical protein BGI34_10390 [Snodgrassella alvi]